jgi:hypothetical protein
MLRFCIVLIVGSLALAGLEARRRYALAEAEPVDADTALICVSDDGVPLGRESESARAGREAGKLIRCQKPPTAEECAHMADAFSRVMAECPRALP